jgi:cytochrome c oxidase subunit I+III
MSWGTLTTSVGLLFAMPSVTLAFFFLWMDRQFGSHIFHSAGGSQPLLWQHLFWIWGHPWVYAIVLPAISMISQMLPVNCRRPLVGYTAVALATLLTMVLGFGVWLHHMFATGLSTLALSFFGAVSILIVIPSAVSFFAWIATIWTGRPVLNTSFLFCAGFIVVFVIGGVSGFMTGSVPADWQLTDTYWVVAHIHYVLIGINLFPVLGAVHFWFPKIIGKMMNERLGKLSFWVTFVGFNFGFFTMHITGLLGMPRRVFTYADGLGLDTVNVITTIGAFILAFGILLFFINVFMSLRSGPSAGPNPWDAGTLEWATSSPPPPYNFAVIPTIASRHPLWEKRLEEGEGESVLTRGMALDDHHETLAVSPLDGEPALILKMPSETYAPVLLTVCLMGLFYGLIALLWWLVILSIIAGLAVSIYWLWPRAEVGQIEEAAHG